MSEEIVTCPGCAKKFRLPEGAQSGSFPCTACNANVPYGPAAKGKAGGRPAPAMSRPAPAAAQARSAAVAPPRESSSRRAPASRRGSRRDEEPEQQKGNPALLWGGIALGVAVIVGAYVATRPSPKAPEPAAQPPVAKPVTTTPTPASSGEQPKPVAEKPKPADPAPVPPEPVRPAPASNNGPEVKVPVGPEIVRAPDVAVARDSMAVLGQMVPSVKGMTDEERADMDRTVAVAMDFDSGRDGAVAEAKLIKAGKKAMPSILSAFSKQFTNGKWGTEKEQWSGDKLQDLLHRITGADCPREADFWPKFSPGSLTPPEDFEKSCKNWLSWWNNAGAMKDKYKQRND